MTKEQYDTLKSEKETLEQKVSDMEMSHSAELNKVQYDMLLDSALKGSGVRGDKALKFAKITLDELGEDTIKLEDGKLVGIDDALKGMKESEDTSFLFTPNEPAQSFTSFSDKTGDNGGDAKVNPFLAELAKIK